MRVEYTHTRILHVSQGIVGMHVDLPPALPIWYKHFDLELRGPDLDRSDRSGQAGHGHASPGDGPVFEPV